jgi:site-specific DNA-methyltransferase (cytosine-N4-specific)
LKSLLLAVFSSIIVRVSFQDSDTRYARVEKQITTNYINKTFKSKLQNLIQDLLEVEPLKKEKTIVKLADSRKVSIYKKRLRSFNCNSPPY